MLWVSNWHIFEGTTLRIQKKYETLVWIVTSRETRPAQDLGVSDSFVGP